MVIQQNNSVTRFLCERSRRLAVSSCNELPVHSYLIWFNLDFLLLEIEIALDAAWDRMPIADAKYNYGNVF